MNENQPSLENDLLNSEYIKNKCKTSDVYSQNLYAAMANNLFYKNDEEWSCSWRCAGGIVADLNEIGDYMDWYCSGICANETTGYVVEGYVTSEISNDILNLGWHHKPYES
jgi:hypothetical protein